MERSHNWKIVPLAILVSLMHAGMNIAADPFLLCTTEVRAASIQPANSPVLLTVRITNPTGVAIPFESASGSPYPEAALFPATITDAKGQTQELSICNDQDIPGSTWSRQLKGRQSVDMPAMIIHGLPEGSYTIQVRGGKSAKVAIKDDAEIARKWDEELVAKIRKGDLFANHVAFLYLRSKHARPSLVDALVRELSCDNEKEAERIAYALNNAPQLPAKAEGIINEGIRKQLQLVKERGATKTAILGALTSMASQIGSDRALESVLAVARTPQVRGQAIWPLAGFKQEKAAQELHLYLNDENDEFQFRAAQRLSGRKDPEALKVLLTVAHDPKSRWRMYSFEALLKYPDDPRVEPAIKSGLDDSNSQVGQFAQIALRQLAQQKKQKP
jgi:HEAT repeats